MKKPFTLQNPAQAHASTLKRRSVKGRQVANNREPAWSVEAREKAQEVGVKTGRRWGRS